MPGLTIDHWGPAGWNMLHVVAHSYAHEPTDTERTDMQQFLQLFAQHLPCPSCRRHFTQYLDQHLDARALSSRTELVRLLNDAHNSVNRRLGKHTWSLEDHYRVYRRGKGGNAANDAGGAFVLVLLVMMLMVVFAIRRRGKDAMCERVGRVTLG